MCNHLPLDPRFSRTHFQQLCFTGWVASNTEPGAVTSTDRLLALIPHLNGLSTSIWLPPAQWVHPQTTPMASTLLHLNWGYCLFSVAFHCIYQWRHQLPYMCKFHYCFFYGPMDLPHLSTPVSWLISKASCKQDIGWDSHLHDLSYQNW